MKIERTKNATRNIILGVVLKIYQIIIPFLMRTAMIYFMGVQYLGLNSLFTSILQVLNLTELGVGSAMVYSMYKPIADDDTKTISALLKLYRLYYRIIGLVIAVLGCILTPFIPYLIKSDLPVGLNIYILYLLNLVATVLSYWLFAYKNSLFLAHQRIDVTSKITLITNTFQYLAQIIIIVYIKNYYLYVFITLLTQALTNIVTAIEATRKFPDYKPEGKLDRQQVKDINHRIQDLFTSKLGNVIVNSADTVVISAFLGLTMLAIYQNYYYILTSVCGFVTIIFQSCTAGIGNSVILESKDKNFNDLKRFTFLIMWISGFCTCCFLCLYQPFMKIWVGDELMLGFSAVICFCIYYFTFEINQLLNMYKDAAGIWHEDRFRPLTTAMINLVLNLITVQFCGIYGVILSTVISTLFVGMPWLLHNLFTVLFDKNDLLSYLLRLLKYSAIVFMSCVMCYLVCSFVNISDLWDLIIKAVICIIIPNLMYFLIYYKSSEFRQSIQLLDIMTGKKFKIESRFFKENSKNKI